MGVAAISSIDPNQKETLVSILDRVNSEAPKIILTSPTSSPLMVKNVLSNFYLGATQKIISSRELKAYDKFKITLLDHSSLLINPPVGYREFLNYAGLNETMADCYQSGYRVYQTKNNTIYTPNVIGCKKKSPYGKYRSSCNSASRLVSVIDEFCYQKNVQKFIECTLTIPKHISMELSKDPAAAIKKLNLAFRYWISELEEFYGGQLGVSYNVHVWSTQYLTPHFHVHATILCTILKDGKFNQIDPFLSLSSIETLRAKWGSCLSRAKIKYGDHDKDNFYWHYSKANEGESLDRPALMHWLKYASRSPLVDVSSFYKDHDFDESQYTESWAKTLCNYVNRRKYLGFLRRLNSYVDKKTIKKEQYSPFDGSPVKKVEIVNADTHALSMDKHDMLLIEWDHKMKKYRVWIPYGFTENIQPKTNEEQDKKIHELMDLVLSGKISRHLYDKMIHEILGLNVKSSENNEGLLNVGI